MKELDANGIRDLSEVHPSRFQWPHSMATGYNIFYYLVVVSIVPYITFIFSVQYKILNFRATGSTIGFFRSTPASFLV